MKKIFVVCTGPSLKEFDLNKLKNEDTIVVNMAYKYVPDWNYMVAIDEIVFDRMKNEQGDLSTIKNRVIYTRDFFTTDIKIPYHVKSNGEFIHVLRLRASKDLLEPRHGMICSRNNSGYMAVSLALKLGYKDIRILGMDLNKAGHFFDNVRYDYSNVVGYMGQLNDILVERMPDVMIYRYDYGDWEGFIKVGKEEILR